MIVVIAPAALLAFSANWRAAHYQDVFMLSSLRGQSWA